MEKLVLQVLVNDDETNYCAKCCKTLNVIGRMIEEVPAIRENIEIFYEDITSEKVIEKYGVLVPPVIIINNAIYSEGHVPVIKKLGREILNMLNYKK
ncbi:MAG: thioredoxin family protein [Promethearchaeota archaeon]